MIKFDSPLRRVPPGIDPKQSLLLDGVRHAAEMATLADLRLRATLTTIAKADDNGTEESAARVTSAYLDAWGIVDSLDRVRALFGQIPSLPDFEERTAALLAELRPIRDLRNVADHLATRIEYVIARKTPALGFLRWITVTGPREALTCILSPGTMGTSIQFGFANPAGREIRTPTGLILLAAGEYETCLCDAISVGAKLVEALEKGLVAAAEANGVKGQQMWADMFGRAQLQFHDVKSDASEGGALPGQPPAAQGSI